MDTVVHFCTPRQPTAHFRGHHLQTPTRNHQDNLPLAQTNLQTFTPNILPHATCLLLLWLPKILQDSDHVRTFSFTNPFPTIRKSIELSPLSVPHNSNTNTSPSNSKDSTSFDKPAPPTHTNTTSNITQKSSLPQLLHVDDTHKNSVNHNESHHIKDTNSSPTLSNTPTLPLPTPNAYPALELITQPLPEFETTINQTNTNKHLPILHTIDLSEPFTLD